jgi:hypothetical protein
MRFEGRDPAMRIERFGRYWAVRDGRGLICVTVYKCGAREVARRLGRHKRRGQPNTGGALRSKRRRKGGAPWPALHA